MTDRPDWLLVLQADHIERLEEENAKLKAKNDELKKEIYKLNLTIDFMKVTEHSAINKYNKYKQTLTEIKVLTIVLQNICPPFIKDGNDSMVVLKQILQKISEVLDG